MIKFGTGGFRAVIGEDFTKENIQILSKALCDKMKKEGVENTGMVIGYDRRFLSKEAMQWAVGSGLIQGSNNALTPQANASRAQIATILMRFCELMKK